MLLRVLADKASRGRQHENCFLHPLRPISVSQIAVRTFKYCRQLMDVLRDFTGTECFTFIDDILIFANDIQEHARRLEHVLQRSDRAKLQLQLGNCILAESKVELSQPAIGCLNSVTMRKLLEDSTRQKTPFTLFHIWLSFWRLVGWLREGHGGAGKGWSADGLCEVLCVCRTLVSWSSLRKVAGFW